MTGYWPQHAEKLHEAGFDPIPITSHTSRHPHAGKAPAVKKGWQTKPFEEINAEGSFENCGIGLRTGLPLCHLVGADVDVRNVDAVAEIESYILDRVPTALKRVGQAPKALYCFRCTDSFTKRQTPEYRLPEDKPGDKGHRFEILGRGQQFVAYGVHPGTGQPYDWGDFDLLELRVTDLPEVDLAVLDEMLDGVDEIIARYGTPISKKTRKRRASSKPKDEEDAHLFPNKQTNIEDIKRALSFIPNDEADWDYWNTIGMAAFDASHGSDEGLEVFVEWSRKASKFDEATTRARWPSYFGTPPDQVSYGTLVHEARQIDPHFKGGEYGRAIAELNQKYFVADMGGSVPIACIETDPITGRERLVFTKPADFTLKYRHRTYLIGVNPNTGKSIYKDLGSAWLADSARRTYDGVTIDPHNDPPPNIFNLWRGFGIQPAAGDWSIIRRHLLEIACSGRRDYYDYLNQLLARWVQTPAERGEVAIVMRGKKGTGKGTVAQLMARIFRHHTMQITHSKHLVGNFNSHLADCLFLFLDEAFWGGDKQGESVLKGLITEPVMTIEPKGINSFQMPNRLKIMMASNADWVVPASQDERRYFVLDVSEERAGDFEYFHRLHEAIEGPELGAMLHDLLAMDLTSFNHRDVPHTEGLNRQKLVSADTLTSYWHDCLDAGKILETECDYWPEYVDKEKFHAAYVNYSHDLGDRHPWGLAMMSKKLKELAPSLKARRPGKAEDPSRRRRYLLQSLQDHRDEFLKTMRIDPSSYTWGEDD